MACDANSVLQALATKTTAFNSTGVNLPGGTPRRGLKARFIVSNYSAAGAGAVWTPAVDASTDNTTYIRVGQGVPLTCGTGAATSEQSVPFDIGPDYVYVRSALDLSPTTSTPSISYRADLVLGRPG